MLEQETEHIVAIARQRTIGSAQSIALKDILAADIPVPVKAFFRADVEARLLDEQRQYRRTSRFDFRHPEVQSLQYQMNSLLVLHFSFEQEEYLRRLDETIHVIANYLVRPQWTLTNVLFEREQSISASGLLQLVRYFGPYEYFKDILSRYVYEQNVASLTKDEFAALVWRMDAAYVRRKSGDELARVLTPLFDFFDYPKRSDIRSLPIRALIKYFEEKGLSSVLLMLEGEVAQGKNILTYGELGELLENTRRTSGAFEAVKIEPTPPVSIEASSSVATEPSLPEQKDEVQQESAIVVTKPTRVLELNEGEQKRYTRRIFRQDDTAFATAMSALGHAASWEEASKIIDEIFIQSVIDPYSSDALRFTETLFKQFHREQ